MKFRSCVFALSIALGTLPLAWIPTVAQNPASPETVLEPGKSLYSHGNEERIVRHFFRDRRDGFFLDVGAFHWQTDSTTLYLEKHLGWSGIAIDAQAEYGEGYAKNRPKTRFYSYLVTDHSEDVETLYLAGQLSSKDKTHLDAFPAMKGFEAPEIRVPTITLNDLLDQNDVDRIDFLSMDIEGAEPEALAGFEIERFRPALVCIEIAAKHREKVAAYFKSHGYERIEAYSRHDPVNWYYKPRTNR